MSDAATATATATATAPAPAPAPATEPRFNYVDKIVNLLALGERAGTDAEAEAAYAKAAAMMARYQIEQAEIDTARREAEAGTSPASEQISKIRLWFPGVYSREHGSGIGTILSALYGKTLFITISRGVHYDYRRVSSVPDTRKGRYVIITGFDSDITVARLLTLSIQLQAQTALTRWWKVEREYPSQVSDLNRRRAYLIGFYYGAGSAILSAKHRTVTESGSGSELALIDRAALVQAALADEDKNLRPACLPEYDTDSVLAGAADGRLANVSANAEVTAEAPLDPKGELT